MSRQKWQFDVVDTLLIDKKILRHNLNEEKNQILLHSSVLFYHKIYNIIYNIILMVIRWKFITLYYVTPFGIFSH